MRFGQATPWAVWLAAAMTGAGCTGNGQGLDANGNPVGSGGSSSVPLTADFESIQDNVFTPICTRCHIGASAPEGLQLDAAHSYQLLVGVPSVEQPSLLRVKPGDPDDSYMVRKLEGGPDISGGQMPLGGPYLPQSTINVIRQWITDGAQMGTAMATAMHARRPSFEVLATSPADSATVNAPVEDIAIAFTQELDASLLNATTIVVEKVSAGTELLTPVGLPLPARMALAPGDASTVILKPELPLQAGRYRVSVRGTGGGALADVNAIPLGIDYYFVFTVEAPR